MSELILCGCGDSGPLKPEGMQILKARSNNVAIFAGNMWNISRAQTLSLIEEAFKELSSFGRPNFRFIDWRNAEQGRDTRIFLVTNAQMDYYYKGEGIPLGLAWSDGTIYLNREREIRNLADVRTLQALTQHEYLHTLGWKHVSDRNYVMHPWLTAGFMHPAEVRRYQRNVGRPGSIFYPPDRGRVGREIRRLVRELDLLWAEHADFVAKRAASTDKEYRKTMTEGALEVVDDLIEVYQTLRPLNPRWWELNNRWKGTPMAHVVTKS